MTLYIHMTAKEKRRYLQVKAWKHEAHILLDLMFDKLGYFHKYNYIAHKINRIGQRNVHFSNMDNLEVIEALAYLKERAWRKGFVKLPIEIL